MSEAHSDEHSSWIKTPKQLLIVVLLAFLVPITLFAMLSQLVTTGFDASKNNPTLSDEAIARRLKPVGEVEVIDANAPRVEKTGKEVVDAVCVACHGTGLLGAPKIGDKAAWASRLRTGVEQMTHNAIQGIRQMPPRGGNPDLSDTEISRAIVYMANQSGANFKEPAPKATAAPAPVAAPPTGAVPASPAPASQTTTPSASAAIPVKAGADQGKTIFEATCIACHGTGVANAPKPGDKAAWAPRLKTGKEALYASALHGKGAMPPKGGNATLADADVKAAVDYMTALAK